MARHPRCRSRQCGVLLFATILAGAACGGPDAGAGDVDATDTAPADTTIAVCDLLTDAEVSQVLPGHDGGIVTSAGGSLVEGVDRYQCSYTARGENVSEFDLLTVVVTVAADAGLFEQVRPVPDARRDMYDNVTDIDAGDGGFTYGDPGDMMVDLWQGRTAVSLELVADDAATHIDALVALAAQVLTNAIS